MKRITNMTPYAHQNIAKLAARNKRVLNKVNRYISRNKDAYKSKDDVRVTYFETSDSQDFHGT